MLMSERWQISDLNLDIERVFQLSSAAAPAVVGYDNGTRLGKGERDGLRGRP